MLNDFNKLCAYRLLACVLLMVSAGELLGCILPPPTKESPKEGQPLALDFKSVTPLSPKQDLTRLFGEQVLFSVENAVVAPAGSTNFYWYVNFKTESPRLHDHQGDPFVLDGCSELVAVGDPETYIVEVLITEGIVAIDKSITEGDPRFTVNGEPILKHTWAVEVFGIGGEECKAPEETVLP